MGCVAARRRNGWQEDGEVWRISGFVLAVHWLLASLIVSNSAIAGEVLTAPGKTASTSAELRENARIGAGLFERLWVAAPASVAGADGLGPLYNARSCSSCHPRGRRGSGSGGAGDGQGGLVLRLGMTARKGEPGDSRGDPIYGRQLQTRALPGMPVEGAIKTHVDSRNVHLGDGDVVRLHRPRFEIGQLGYGALSGATRISARLPPPLVGVADLERVAESAILALADPVDRNADGISGRVHRVLSTGGNAGCVGRFGWKATHCSLRAQVEQAFADDMGIGTAGRPDGWGDCTTRQPDCRGAPHGDSKEGGDLEAAPSEVERIIAYLRTGFERRSIGPVEEKGKQYFKEYGCADCHIPRLPDEQGRSLWVYTDLLLHDMGDGLADDVAEHDASGREWRTAPLTDLGAEEIALLHDGRARNLSEAILWHDGEAAASRGAFRAASAHARGHLLRFLRTL